ncbi:MAG: porin family protein [Flavobacteriales bacterium]
MFCLSISTTYCSAQIDFSGGIELGAATSQVSGDGLGGFDKFGLSGGPFVRAEFSETSSVRMSILYVNKGSRRNANPDNGDFRTYVLKLDYLEVPILYNYTYKSFRAELGIAPGFLINSVEIENGIERPFVQPFESLEFSVVGGVNYMFTENLFVNLRLSQSIIPVRKAPSVVNPLSFYEAGQYNSVIQLMFGYEF